MDASSFRANYEECRAEAAKAIASSAKAQWLLFAEEWLKQAQAAEAQQGRDAATANRSSKVRMPVERATIAPASRPQEGPTARRQRRSRASG
jgi:hypothetical protein